MCDEDIEKPVLRAVKELNENNGATIPEIVSYVMCDYADHRKRVESTVTKIVKRILRRKKGKGLITSVRGHYRLSTRRNKALPRVYKSGFLIGSCPVCGQRASKKEKGKDKGTRNRRQPRKRTKSKRRQSNKATKIKGRRNPRRQR